MDHWLGLSDKKCREALGMCSCSNLTILFAINCILSHCPFWDHMQFIAFKYIHIVTFLLNNHGSTGNGPYLCQDFDIITSS